MKHTIRSMNRAGMAGLVLAAAGLVACGGDSTEPVVDYEPAVTLDQLDDVLAPLDSNDGVLLGLDLAVATLDYYGATTLADAVSIRPARGEGLKSALRPAASRGDAGTWADAGTAADMTGSAFTLPSAFLGRTLVWDPVDGYVVSSRSGAPTSGTRFVLYQMDWSSGYPTTPLVEVGWIDLIDADGATREGVRVVAVERLGADREVADYVVRMSSSGSYTEGAMQVTTTGTFGAVGAVDLDLYQQFAWSAGQDRDELTLDYSYRIGAREVTLDGRADSRYEAPSWETFEFELGFHGNGPLVEVEARIAGDSSLDGEIRRDGRRAITVGGYDGQPTFRGVNGLDLDFSDESALEALFTGIGDLIWLTDWVMSPADLLVLDG